AVQLGTGVTRMARAVRTQPRGNNPGFLQPMVEDDQAVVEADVAIRQLEIVDGSPGQFGFAKILQLVAPVAEAAAGREWQVEVIEQFVAGHEGIEHMPRIPEEARAAGE